MTTIQMTAAPIEYEEDTIGADNCYDYNDYDYYDYEQNYATDNAGGHYATSPENNDSWVLAVFNEDVPGPPDFQSELHSKAKKVNDEDHIVFPQEQDDSSDEICWILYGSATSTSAATTSATSTTTGTRR